MEANHNLFRFWGYRKMSLILTYLHRVHYLLIIIEVAWMNHGKTSIDYWSGRQSRILVIVIRHDWESRYIKLDLISFCLPQPILFYLIQTKFWFNSLPYPTVNSLGHWSIVHIWVVLTSPNFLDFSGIKWGLPLRPLSITLISFDPWIKLKLSGIGSRDEGNDWKCYHFLLIKYGTAIFFVCVHFHSARGKHQVWRSK